MHRHQPACPAEASQQADGWHSLLAAPAPGPNSAQPLLCVSRPPSHTACLRRLQRHQANPLGSPHPGGSAHGSNLSLLHPLSSGVRGDNPCQPQPHGAHPLAGENERAALFQSTAQLRPHAVPRHPGHLWTSTGLAVPRLPRLWVWLPGPSTGVTGACGCGEWVPAPGRWDVLTAECLPLANGGQELLVPSLVLPPQGPSVWGWSLPECQASQRLTQGTWGGRVGVPPRLTLAGCLLYQRGRPQATSPTSPCQQVRCTTALAWVMGRVGAHPRPTPDPPNAWTTSG